MRSEGAAIENSLDRQAEMRHHLRLQDVLPLGSIRQTWRAPGGNNFQATPSKSPKAVHQRPPLHLAIYPKTRYPKTRRARRVPPPILFKQSPCFQLFRDMEGVKTLSANGFAAESSMEST